jgi:hypothetical protein
MMRRFFFLLLIFVSSQTLAQVFPFELWHDGKIILDTGDTLRGTVKYDLQDLLQIKHNQRLESFSARKVLLFEIFDQTYRRYRQFYSLPYSENGSYKTPVFFEVITEGKITVLAREKVEIRSNNYSPYSSYPGMYPRYNYGSRRVLVNTYFLLKENGNIESFSGRKNDWYDLMGNRANDVHDYVKENNLSFDKKYDIKLIIEYYNSFFERK